jgi:hypothetical protein
MENIDITIYMNQFKNFFEKNPQSLYELIGNLNGELFFKKVEEVCLENYKKGDEISLTQKQILDLVSKLYKQKKKNNISGIFEMSKYGLISLN